MKGLMEFVCPIPVWENMEGATYTQFIVHQACWRSGLDFLTLKGVSSRLVSLRIYPVLLT